MGARARVLVVSVCAVTSAASAFVACALDESGTSSPDASLQDVVTPDNVLLDVPVVDNFVPPPCSDPDASVDASCLPKPVPAGWIPVGIQVDASTTCPSSDFTTEQYLEDPQLAPGACTCTGCTRTGVWSCSYQMKAGQTCTQDTFDASASACWSIPHGSVDLTATRSGSPTCGGGQQTGNQDASATPVTACVPACKSDYCGLAGQGYTLCVLNSNVSDGGCPTDFPNAHLVGLSTVMGCNSCQTCGLQNGDASCNAGYTSYALGGCTGTVVGSGSAGAACDTTANFLSISLDAGGVAEPNCGAATGTTGGSVALVGPLTICCP